MHTLKPQVYILLFLILQSCKEAPKLENKPTKNSEKTEIPENIENIVPDTISKHTLTDIPEPTKSLPAKSAKANSKSWSELTSNEGFILDLKYASTDNFTKKQIYDCARCYMRPEAAEQLRLIRDELKEKYGYGIRIFDCYRPGPYQQRLWDIVPDPNYVTPPNKGSMHSRGLAIDLTLTDKSGRDLDMGTPFDFFGKEAHHGYAAHTDTVKRHRWILRSTMEKYGFGSIRTEWWHYSFKNKSYALDQWVWPCE